MTRRAVALYALVALLILGTGFLQSWNTALFILNMGLISAVMALGVNLQWGFAGLFNVGIMGFVALGGLGAVLTAMPPVGAACQAGGLRILLALAVGAGVIAGAILGWKRVAPRRRRTLFMLGWLGVGFFVFRWAFEPAVAAIEAMDPAATGYLGGLGLPVLIGWPVGALLAEGAA
jgi:ABC-type branched-chain amino acid transport system, permease component